MSKIVPIRPDTISCYVFDHEYVNGKHVLTLAEPKLGLMVENEDIVEAETMAYVAVSNQFVPDGIEPRIEVRKTRQH